MTDTRAGRETFVAHNSDKELIIRTYKSIFKAHEPSAYEVSFFSKYLEVKPKARDDHGMLREAMVLIVPALRNMHDASGITETSSALKITQVYNRMLGRDPTKEEILLHSSTKGKLDEERLAVLLASGQEYARKERAQSNDVFFNLKGNVTERQLRMELGELYKDVTGKEDLEEDLFKFLRVKYVELELDKKEMKEFMKAYVSNKPVPCSNMRHEATNDKRPFSEVANEVVRMMVSLDKGRMPSADAVEMIALAVHSSSCLNLDVEAIVRKYLDMEGNSAANRKLIECLINELLSKQKDSVRASTELADLIRDRNEEYQKQKCTYNYRPMMAGSELDPTELNDLETIREQDQCRHAPTSPKRTRVS